MRNRRLALALGLVVTLAARDAHGEPPDDEAIVHLQSPSAVTTDGGTSLRLPPGYFLDESTWHTRDAEMRRLQELETRLKAENASLRASANKPSWWIVAGVALGAAVGAGGYWYATK